MSKKLAIAVAMGLIASSALCVTPVKAVETVVNATFEEGTNNWFNNGGCNLMQASWVKHNGNNSLYERKFSNSTN